MPFIEPPLVIKEKLQLGRVSTPVLVGVVAVMIVVGVFAATSAFSLLGGDSFTVTKEDASDTQGGGDKPVDAAGDSSDGGSKSPSQGAASEGEAASAASEQARKIVVYVCGSVAKPGVYALPHGSRIQGAVKAAGGFSENAAKEALNLAQPLQDGQRVDVPSKEEYLAAAEGGSAGGVPAVSDGASLPSQTTGSVQQGLVNINSATEAELVSLPGVGEATAAKIVASREAEGPFLTLEDLMRVSGIGEKKFQSLKDSICV